MNLVDSKFIGIISARLEKFKKVKNNLYNFRCPICGDSKKNKSKTRGYLYNVKADINFRCHNCGASMTFSNFLKQLDPVIHKQYVFERFKNNSTGRGTVVEEPTFNFETPKFKKKSAFLYALRYNVGENISKGVDSIPKSFTGRKTLQGLSTRLNQRLDRMFRKSLEL